MAPAAAGVAASAYWGSIFAGRLAFGALAPHVAPSTLLRLGMAGAPLAALAVCLTRGGAGGFAGLFALGLLLAPIFPLLIAETPARVGERHAAHAIGFQISAATLGAGALPALAGLLARHAGLESLGPFLLGDDRRSSCCSTSGAPAAERPGTRRARAILASLPLHPRSHGSNLRRSPPTPRRWPRRKRPPSSLCFPTPISRRSCAP